jgi:hypothetical protein
VRIGCGLRLVGIGGTVQRLSDRAVVDRIEKMDRLTVVGADELARNRRPLFLRRRPRRSIGAEIDLLIYLRVKGIRIDNVSFMG